MDKLVLIDGNSLINRAFYANPPLINKDGKATGAVYGFLNMLIKIYNDISPSFLCVAFDMRAKTFRHKLYDNYKSNRKGMPDELAEQMPILKDVLSSLDIKIIEKEGYEADDLIGTISKKFKTQTYIITGDRDSFQLVDECTTVYFTKRGISDLDILDNENFVLKTKLKPIQMIELKSLMGDSSDTVPGVMGIGEKTALALLEKYETLDGVYANINEIKGKVQEKLIENKEMAYLSKKLVTIDINVPIDMELYDMKTSFPFPQKSKQKMLELDFKSLAKKNLFLEDAIMSELENNTENNLGNSTAKKIEARTEIKLIESEQELDKIIKKCRIFSFNNDENISFAVNAETEYVVNVSVNLFGMGFNEEIVYQKLKPIFENEKIEKIVFNKKNLRHVLDLYGIKINGKCEDVSIKKYLVNFSGKEEDISSVLEEYNFPKTEKAISLLKLNEMYDESLKEMNMLELYFEMELPLSDVLYEMENEGFKIDLKTLNMLSEKYKTEIDEKEKLIKDMTGVKNVNSPKQLGEVLFEKLNLKNGKKTKTGFSTSVDILEGLIGQHPVVELILRYRQIQKLYSTYIEGFRNVINPKTNMVHTTFHQTLTSTGRLSSKEPNLQNIPIRENEGKEIRRIFVPSDEKHILLTADYSQIELRLLAYFSGDNNLIKAYNENKDIHSITASEVFNVPLEKVSKEMRRDSKAVNFGIIYGISDFGLAKNINTSVNTAKEYINKYFESYPTVKQYMNESIAFARKTGYAITLFKRRRYIKEINSSNFNLRGFGERAAMNMPLQGTSADIIKIAMINVRNRLLKENLLSRLILQVHDELIINALISEKDKVEKILQEEMENVIKLKVKLVAEVSCGENWLSAK